MKRRIHRLAVLAACALGCGGAVAAPASAATVTTGTAKQIAVDTVSATGVVNTGGAAVELEFEYTDPSGDTNYGDSGTQFIPAGATTPQTVTDTFSGLDPATKYQWTIKAVTNVGYYPPIVSGVNKTFTTAPIGSIKLTSKRVGVKHGVGSFKLRCDSKFLACEGKLGVTTHTSRGKLVNCLAKSTDYSVQPGKTVTLKARISKPCLALLAGSKGLKHSAIFVARPSNDQPRYSAVITLGLVQ